MSKQKKTTESVSDIKNTNAEKPDTDKKAGENAPKKDSVLPAVIIFGIVIAAILTGIVFLAIRGSRAISDSQGKSAETTAAGTGEAITNDDPSGTDTDNPSGNQNSDIGTEETKTTAAPVKIPDTETETVAESMLEIADLNPARLETDEPYKTGDADFKFYQKLVDPTTQDEYIMLSQITDVYEKNGQKYCTCIDYMIYTDETAYRNAKAQYEGTDDTVFYDDKYCIAQIHGMYYDVAVGNAGAGTTRIG